MPPAFLRAKRLRTNKRGCPHCGMGSGMMSGKRKATINASFTITGEANEVLAQAHKVRGPRRAVSLTIELQKPGNLRSPETYHLPRFHDGNTADVRAFIDDLLSQSRISDEDAQRLDSLVRQFVPLLA